MNILCFLPSLLTVIFFITLVKNSRTSFSVVSITEQPDKKDDKQFKNEIQNIISELNLIKFRLSNLENKVSKVATFPESCQEVKERGNTKTGVYIIKPKMSPRSFAVVCDMVTKGGGWTYFFNRKSSGQDFYLNWKDYKNGFGSLNGEHWLGLDNIHYITESEVNEILVVLTDWDNISAYAFYDHFVVGDENSKYLLKAVGEYNGTAGDSMRSYSGRWFTTKDRDNDLRAGSNCAIDEHGAWWYDSCTNSNPTGIYLKQAKQPGLIYKIMYWNTFRGSEYSLKGMTMMVRPKQN